MKFPICFPLKGGYGQLAFGGEPYPDPAAPTLRRRLPGVHITLEGMMSENQKGLGLLQIIWTVAALVMIAAGTIYMLGRRGDPEVKFLTPYQAVLLTNGSVYFGQLEGYGGPSPVLSKVYYIVTQTNSETKQTSNVLVKRGKELHEPDRMYLNPRQILFVEPVGVNSKVAQLIKEQGGQ